MADRAPLQVVYRKTSELVPYARNARTHSPAQVDQIIASVNEFGFTNPVLIDAKGGIIAGHGRVMAAEKMGLKQVPTITLTGLSAAQKRAYILADNRIALSGGWNDDLLKLELGDLQDMDFDLTLTGFTEEEITDIFSTKVGAVEPDEIPDLKEAAVSQTGDVWLMGPHRLCCGDSTNPESVALALKGQKPNLLVSDPPYGVDYDPDWRNKADRANGKPYGARAIGRVEADDRSDWSAAWKLFPGNVAYCWHAGRHASVVHHSFEESGFELRAQIIWAKSNIVIGRGHYHMKHEPCFYLVRKGATANWQGSRKESTLWEIDKPQKSETGHSTQKPVECMKRPIENNSKKGDAVYEPFAGSFTTGIACEMTGRKCLAIEISANYVDLGVRRWMSFTTKEATLEATGETFAAVEKKRLKASSKEPVPKAAKPKREGARKKAAA